MMNLACNRRNWFLALLLMVMTVAAYWPALQGGYLWDDNDHISENLTLRSVHGLWQIWFQPGATCQYYPLSFTGFWIGYQLWGLNPLGYHLLNVLLHSLVALLLWQGLARLQLQGAWLAGALFALHPVCVMSVAWMTELKNPLSAALALGAGWAYLRFAGLGVYAGQNGANVQPSTFNLQHSMNPIPPPGGRLKRWMSDAPTSPSPGPDRARLRWGFYVLALVLFELALLAKTAVSFLPVSLLLVSWWRRPRLGGRDLWPLLPMLGLVGLMGQLTFHIERLHGAAGQPFQLGFWERLLVSGRSFWFYLGKLFYPRELTFIYERWAVDPRVGWQYLYPLATGLLLAGLWWGRHRLGKGLLVALLHFYVCTSLLILLVVLYMTRYSFVSDHWQYFGCMSVLAAVAAGVGKLSKFEIRNSKFEGNSKTEIRNSRPAPFGFRISGFLRTSDFGFRISAALGGALLLALGVLTWRQCGIYTDLETLWRDTLKKNPGCWMVHNNLGMVLAARGDRQEAEKHYREAVRLKPDDGEAYYNLANLLFGTGRRGEAVTHYGQAVRLVPGDADMRNNLGVALHSVQRTDEAIAQFLEAIRLKPDLASAHFNLGVALETQHRRDEAIAQYREVLRLQPDSAPAQARLRVLSAGVTNQSEFLKPPAE